ncbi:MAG: peptide deformylase [bacterium]|nr:peptide deformylase [bacterium]
MDPIVTIATKKSEQFLRTPTKPFNFSRFTKVEVRNLVKRMREAMRQASGVGLSANQIGLSWRIFVAQVPDADGKQKFYAVFNPTLSRPSKEFETTEEGCLSVPGKYGPTPRHYRVTLTGFDQYNRPVKIKAWGLLARVFQHETDHLDGKLFVDRAERLIQIETRDIK